MFHYKHLLSLFLLLCLQACIVFTLEYVPQSVFPNPSRDSVFQDKYRQSYLIGTDSYYYLDQTLSSDNVKNNRNLVVSLYRFLTTFSQKLSVKDPKYFLYFFPFFIALFSISILFFSFSKNSNQLAVFSFCLLLITSPSFFKNTQLGNIDHNAFYVLAVVIIFSLLTLPNRVSTKKTSIDLIGIFILLYVVSTFWGSWYFLLIPVLFLLLPRTFLLNKPVFFTLIPFSCVTVVLITKKFFSSSYFEVLRIKVINIFGSNQTNEISRLNHTQELEGMKFADLVLLEPIVILLVFCAVVMLFKLQHQRQLVKVFPYMFISIIFLIATLLFVRLSIFFVIATIFCLHAYIKLSRINFIEKYFFSISIALIFVLNCWNILNLHVQTERLNDDQYRQFSLIKRLTEKDAVILSWWDYGYYINAISQRYAFLDPGSKSTKDRLSLFANVIYENNASSIKEIRNRSCLERKIDIEECTEEKIPIYLYLNEKFDFFHPIIRRFASIDIQNKLMSEIIDDVYDCQVKGKEIFCGKYQFIKKNMELLLQDNQENIHSIILHSERGIQRYPLSMGSKVLVLFEQDGRYRLAIVNAVMESTLLFKGLFYNDLESFFHKTIHQENIKNKFSLIKLFD